MLEFREILLEDKQWIDEILSKRNYMSCEYCFGNHFIWSKAYKINVARMNEFYVISFVENFGEGTTSFLYPAGVGDLKPVIEELIEYCKKNEIDFILRSASEQDTKELEKLFPGKFEFYSDRDYSDYIYTVEALTNLSGRKLHGKRNHIKRFKDNNWKFEPISADNMEECIEMNKKWCEINDCGREPSLKEEACAIKRSFKYFNELGFFGGLVRIDDRVVAYTIAERMNDDVVVVHLEKAFSDIQGAYPAINREFIANMCQSYKYVNREEDLGFEGLRRAKLSYRPEILLSKYNVKIKE